MVVLFISIDGGAVNFVQGLIYLCWGVVPSPLIVLYLPKTYDKIFGKDVPYRFSGKWDPSVHIYRSINFIIIERFKEAYDDFTII